jgi:hypothetical protein
MTSFTLYCHCSGRTQCFWQMDYSDRQDKLLFNIQANHTAKQLFLSSRFLDITFIQYIYLSQKLYLLKTFTHEIILSILNSVLGSFLSTYIVSKVLLFSIENIAFRYFNFS